MVCCLAMFSTNDVGNSSSKPIFSNPSNPLHFLMRKLMRYVLKYYRIYNLILVCPISNRGRQKCHKCAALAQFEGCLHIFTSGDGQCHITVWRVTSHCVTKTSQNADPQMSKLFSGIQTPSATKILIQLNTRTYKDLL